MMKPNQIISLGAIFMFLAVLLGAFGAHGLQNIVSPQRLVTWNTAVDYLFFHALGLMICGMLEKQNHQSCHQWVAILLLIGIILFSGSLFVLVLFDQSWLGIITPFGGVAFLLAWLILAVCYFNNVVSS